MGISLEAWRSWIGSFTQLALRKSSARDVRLRSICKVLSLSLRLALFALLMSQCIEPNPGPTKGTKGGNSDVERTTRSSHISRVMEKDTPKRSGARNRTNSDKTEMGSKTVGDSSFTSNPVSTTRQDPEQPTINEWFTGRISDTSADKDDAQSSQTTNVALPILIDIQRSIKQMHTKFDNLERSMNDLKQENRHLREENSKLVREMDHLNSKIENLEAQSRRQNLKFFNVPESEKESWEESEHKIRQFMRDTLDIDESTISIERAHRLPGKYKPRPIIAKFSFFKDRERVLQSFRQKRRQGDEGDMVPRSKISVVEDYPQRISKVRRAFTPFLREAINEGKGPTYIMTS